jgi:hypothetical protein
MIALHHFLLSFRPLRRLISMRSQYLLPPFYCYIFKLTQAYASMLSLSLLPDHPFYHRHRHPLHPTLLIPLTHSPTH